MGVFGGRAFRNIGGVFVVGWGGGGGGGGGGWGGPAYNKYHPLIYRSKMLSSYCSKTAASAALCFTCGAMRLRCAALERIFLWAVNLQSLSRLCAAVSSCLQQRFHSVCCFCEFEHSATRSLFSPTPTHVLGYL